MDVSKLPKFSQTPSPPPEQTPNASDATQAAPAYPMHYENRPPKPGLGAEIWLSAAIGLILMFVGGRFLMWAIATMSGKHFATGVNWTAGEKAGTEVDYWELMGYPALTECAIFLFGFALVLEALVLAAAVSKFGTGAKRLLVGFALLITVSATVFNIFVSAVLFRSGVMPIISLLAVAFGVYIAAYEWRLFQMFSSERSSSGTASA